MPLVISENLADIWLIRGGGYTKMKIKKRKEVP
jgi:hypothetical protein